MSEDKLKGLTFDDWLKVNGGWTFFVSQYIELGGDLDTLPAPVKNFLREILKEERVRNGS